LSQPKTSHIELTVKNSVADPGSGRGKKSGSGSDMNNPDHISESMETIFCRSGIRDGKKFGSGIKSRILNTG
jgi:hypothetical protein